MLGVRRKSHLAVFALLIVGVLGITLISYSVGSYPSDLALSIYDVSRKRGLSKIQEWKSCEPLEHIFFLKLHKCGSSTVQNILMRKGKREDLNFVLPEKNNYLGHPEPFEISHIGSGMMDDEEHFDIFTHHSRFHAANVRSVMPQDTKRVTILREPASLFESLYNYYHFQQMFKGSKLDLATLLANSTAENLIDIFDSGPRLAYRIGHNQMAFDFGLDKKSFRDEQKIQELLNLIDAEFDLVLLSEYMEVSMVLLADLMCWPLEEVTFLKLNARPADQHHTPLTTEDKMKIRKLNNVDTVIYDHFREKFKKRVLAYGEARMQADLQRLTAMNQALMDECVEFVMLPKPNATRLQYPVTHYKLYDHAPIYCWELNCNELRFTEMLRERQKNKFAAKKNLYFLLHLT